MSGRIRLCRLCLVAPVALSVFSDAISAQQGCPILHEEAKLLGDTTSDYSYLGTSVAADGNLIACGAWGIAINRGSTFVYRYDSSSGNWIQEAELLADTPTFEREFGNAVSVSAEQVLSGEWKDYFFPGGSQGSAHVHAFNGIDDWCHVAKLIDVEGTSIDRFGAAVAIESNIAVVSAINKTEGGSDDAGAVFVFERTDNVPGDPCDDSWTQVAKLTAPAPLTDEHFGQSVAISADTIVIGTQDESAYVFWYDGNAWIQQGSKLTASNPISTDEFGWSVSISGEVLVVGGPGRLNTGSVTVFERNNNGTPGDGSDDFWVEVDELFAADSASGDGFGTSVSIDGDNLVIGAPDNDELGVRREPPIGSSKIPCWGGSKRPN